MITMPPELKILDILLAGNADAGGTINLGGTTAWAKAIGWFKRWQRIYGLSWPSHTSVKQHAHLACIDYCAGFHTCFAVCFYQYNHSRFAGIRCGESRALYCVSTWDFLDKKLPVVDRSFMHRLFVCDLFRSLARSKVISSAMGTASLHSRQAEMRRPYHTNS